MKIKIKCLLCDANLCEIDKEEITESDIIKYNQIFQCTNHLETQLNVEQTDG